LSNIERGNNFPQTGTLCNLAKALKVEALELFKPEEISGLELQGKIFVEKQIK
jgi:transcriptional regulator with XRE-family HTH domain